MRSILLKIILLAMFFTFAGKNISFPESALSSFSNLLTPADIASISSIRDSILTEKTTKSGKAVLNFTLGDGGQLLTVVIQTVRPEDFREEERSRYFKDSFYGPVQNLGDAAYEGPVKGERYILAFLKGSSWVTMSSYLTVPGLKPIFSQNDLRKLAEIMISRLN
jgi:hypothetical protein